MIKKLRDCTYGEVINFCKKRKKCEGCPLSRISKKLSLFYKMYACDDSPITLSNHEPEALDIEIDIPKEEGE